jgi:hypothetical protein
VWYKESSSSAMIPPQVPIGNLVVFLHPNDSGQRENLFDPCFVEEFIRSRKLANGDIHTRMCAPWGIYLAFSQTQIE